MAKKKALKSKRNRHNGVYNAFKQLIIKGENSYQDSRGITYYYKVSKYVTVKGEDGKDQNIPIAYTSVKSC